MCIYAEHYQNTQLFPSVEYTPWHVVIVVGADMKLRLAEQIFLDKLICWLKNEHIKLM